MRDAGLSRPISNSHPKRTASLNLTPLSQPSNRGPRLHRLFPPRSYPRRNRQRGRPPLQLQLPASFYGILSTLMYCALPSLPHFVPHRPGVSPALFPRNFLRNARPRRSRLSSFASLVKQGWEPVLIANHRIQRQSHTASTTCAPASLLPASSSSLPSPDTAPRLEQIPRRGQLPHPRRFNHFVRNGHRRFRTRSLMFSRTSTTSFAFLFRF